VAEYWSVGVLPKSELHRVAGWDAERAADLDLAVTFLFVSDSIPQHPDISKIRSPSRRFVLVLVLTPRVRPFAPFPVIHCVIIPVVALTRCGYGLSYR
jgi:hypothetical protein